MAYPTSTVVVLRAPFGESEFCGAVADVFDTGTLTITYQTNDPTFDREGDTWKTFPPGTWRECVVQDARGNVLYAFTSNVRVPFTSRYSQGVCSEDRL